MGHKRHHKNTRNHQNSKPSSSNTDSPTHSINNNLISNISQQQLQLQSLQLYQLLINRTKLLKQQQQQICYIISTKWLQSWKQYVGYYNIDSNNGDKDKKNKKIGKKHPGKINIDIVYMDKNKNQHQQQFYYIPMQQYNYLNIIIPQKQQKNTDFIIIPQIIWNIFKSKYQHIQIPRPKYITKKNNIQYSSCNSLQVDMIIVNYMNDELIKEIEQSKISQNTTSRFYDKYFKSNKIQLPELWRIKQLNSFLQKYCYTEYKTTKFKLWKGQTYQTCGILQKQIYSGIHNKSQKYPASCRQIIMNPQPQNKYTTLQLQDFLRSYYTLILQIYPQTQSNRIIPAQVPNKIQGYCQQCVKKKQLTIWCQCEEVFYCSEECKVNDQSFHQNICQKVYDSQDDDHYERMVLEIVHNHCPIQQEQNKNNKKNKNKNNKKYNKNKQQIKDNILIQNQSITGLNNLGNTCYMNSIIQALISIKQLTNYFITNQFMRNKQMDSKQYQQNKCRLLYKYSKLLKQLILSSQSQALNPWSFKSQVNYFLSPFRGFKQHDANDFLINFITALNQQLFKQQNQSYHKVLKQNFLGQFTSLITCPQCSIQIINDEIFTQISLPIKHKQKKYIINYIIYENYNKIIKGKFYLMNSWTMLRKSLGLTQNCIIYQAKQAEHANQIEQSTQDVQKYVKKLKKQLIFYKNINKSNQNNQNYTYFSVLPITIKNLYGNQMKSQYSYPALIKVNLQLESIVTLIIRILEEYCKKEDNVNIISEAKQIQRLCHQDIQKIYEEYNQQDKGQSTQSSNLEDKQKQIDTQKQKQLKIKQIQQKHNKNFIQLLKKYKIIIYINDLKKNRNICFSCKKKCSGCELPINIILNLKDYLQDKKPNQINFQILLAQKIQPQKVTQDKVGSEQSNLQDCLSLFTQPQQLDEQNAWYCQSCDNMRLALKQLNIKKLPKILIIHLNRFKNDGNKKVKNSEPVEYQEYQIFENKNYQLLSAIIHEGSTEGGHYWAICRRNQKYYIFNDSKVSQTQKICNKNAYILVYKLCEQ